MTNRATIIYLHSDLQRQLIGILKDAGPRIVVATHSTEIMGESDPADIVVIDKTRNHSTRLKHVNAVQSALTNIGSIHNITLVQLARTRRILYVEDVEDFVLLRSLARRLKLSTLADGSTITPMKSGGYGSWKEISGMAKRIEEATGADFKIAAIYDRDYRSPNEIEDITTNLRKHLAFAAVLERKEIENYLLVPSVLDRLVYTLAKRQADVSAPGSISEVDASGHLEEITEHQRHEIQSQYIARHNEYSRNSGKDASATTKEITQWFEAQWQNLDTRLNIVPGKSVLASFRDKMRQMYSISFSNVKIAEEFRPDEISTDMHNLLTNISSFGGTVSIES